MAYRARAGSRPFGGGRGRFAADDEAEMKGVAMAKAKRSGVATQKSKYFSPKKMIALEDSATRAKTQLEESKKKLEEAETKGKLGVAEHVDFVVAKLHAKEAEQAVPGAKKVEEKKKTRMEQAMEEKAKYDFWASMVPDEHGKYKGFGERVKKALKTKAAKERRDQKRSETIEEMKQRQLRELQSMGLKSMTESMAESMTADVCESGSIALGKINPKIEGSTDVGERLRFNRPENVATEEWAKADVEEMDALPILYLLALDEASDRLAALMEVSGGEFSFRRMNKIMRVNLAMKKRQQLYADRKQEFPTLAGLIEPYGRVEPNSAEQVRGFLEKLTKDHGVHFPLPDVGRIVGTLFMDRPSTPGFVAALLVKYLNEGTLFRTISLNVALPVIHLLSIVIRR